MLDLENNCFSYKQSRGSKKSRFGIRLSLIKSIQENAEKIWSPPQGYPNGFVVNTESHMFVLFTEQKNYDKWINAFASVQEIAIRPKLVTTELDKKK